jgi:thiol-disulfide isomerase/thioredoxin
MKRPLIFKRMKQGLILLLLGCTLILRAEDPEPLEIGAAAPDFNLPGIDGKQYSLDSFKDARVLTIVFTANHCPTAQAYEERLKKLSADYPPEQMQLVAISSNHPGAVCLEELGYTDLGDSFEEMKIRAAEKSFNYPYLYDGEEQATALAYGAVATPHVFIFDRDRKLRYRGRVDDMEDPYQQPTRNDARNAIEALLAGRPVPVETTRAFGCSMKWKSKVAWRQQLDEQWAEKPVVLEDIDTPGVEALLANREGNLRLINLWATWCGPCIIEFPDLVELQRMYGQRHFEVVTISMDRANIRPKVLEFLEDKHAAVLNYLFTEQDREPLFEVIDPDWQGNIPYTMIIKPDGEVIYRHDGIIDALEVKKVIVGQLGRYFADDK